MPHTIDLFADGSLLIVNAPGHLQGHINILAHTSSSLDHYMYLAGDACHDRRLLTGEKEIGEWMDAGGRGCCIHVDKEEAGRTIGRIRRRRAWRLCLRMMESGRGRIRGGSGARERRRLSTSEKEKETEMEADGKWGC
jgi:glyoxylase-like metal-dependent hydrolase (beta-lactamase superfamily II)